MRSPPTSAPSSRKSKRAGLAACAALPARWPPAASRPPVVVIGVTYRSPPSCGARKARLSRVNCFGGRGPFCPRSEHRALQQRPLRHRPHGLSSSTGRRLTVTGRRALSVRASREGLTPRQPAPPEQGGFRDSGDVVGAPATKRDLLTT